MSFTNVPNVQEGNVISLHGLCLQGVKFLPKRSSLGAGAGAGIVLRAKTCCLTAITCMK